MANPREAHFFQPLLPGFDSGLTIPLGFFSKHIEGNPNQNTWKLKTDASEKTWEVIQEGKRLSGGWKDFTSAHDLRIGDIVIFKHEEDMVFHVTPFGPSCCEIQYENQHSETSSSFSFDYCFNAKVTASNLKADQLYFPVAATSCNALNKRCHEMILVNQEGTSWTVSLGFRETTGLFYIRRGWTRFCLENGRKVGDSFRFNAVGDGKTTPLMCVCSDEEVSSKARVKNKSKSREL